MSKHINYSPILYLLLLLISIFHPQQANAQIIPDHTLPQNSQVQPGCTVCEIKGGTVEGVNLFHSFQEFSIPKNGQALFNNRLEIQNILTRVTGNNISNIDGLISANGSANLFFINPNGIIFGENASLRINGSFLASTANSIKFADGNHFSVKGAENTPLLTITAPIGLQFGNHQSSIQVQTKTGLEINPNQTLALVGGDVQFNGGIVKTNGGRLELGSVKAPGLVNFSFTNQGFLLNYNQINQFGNIQITDQSDIDASGIGGGEIQIQTRNLHISGSSRIASLTLGELSGGKININATDTIEMIGSGDFETKVDAVVNPNIDITQGEDGFFILSVGSGNTGSLDINTNKLILKNSFALLVSTLGEGNGNDFQITAYESVELNESLLATGNRLESSGDAGNLNINTRKLSLDNRGFIGSTSFGSGKAGNIIINASESIELTSGEFFTQDSNGISFNTNINASSVGIADAGNIEINTQQLTIRENTLISAATLGSGNGGNLTINATDVFIVGKNLADLGFVTGLSSSSEINATGNGGNLIINADNLQMQGGTISAGTVGVGGGGNLLINVNKMQVRDGGQITVSTSGAGNAGNLTVNAGDIQIMGNDIYGFSSGFFATSGLNATGSAGDIKVNTNDLQILDQAKISVEALGTGKAGNFNLQANSILMDNLSIISANTRSNSTDLNTEQASINLAALYMIMRNGSQITTNATGNNVIGGNISINVGFLAALENSDITANSTNFRGGNVMITSQGIVGTKFRDQLTPESDIAATGASPEFSGSVDVTFFAQDQYLGLISLSSALVDTENQLAQGCNSNNKSVSQVSRFTISGRGGLPLSPDDLLIGTNPVVDLVELLPRSDHNQDIKDTQSVSYNQNPPQEIVEAQGWMIDTDGKIHLVAQVAKPILKRPILPKNSCSIP